MKVQLFVRCKSELKFIEINRTQTVIGRTHSDLLLDDSLCSRSHALIYSDLNYELRIKDLKSKNGTFINGQKIEDSSLKAGDSIVIGTSELIVMEDQISLTTQKQSPKVKNKEVAKVGRTEIKDILLNTQALLNGYADREPPSIIMGVFIDDPKSSEASIQAFAAGCSKRTLDYFPSKEFDIKGI